MINLNKSFFNNIKDKKIYIKYTNLIDYKNNKLIWNYPNWYPTFDNNINNNIEEKLKLFKNKYLKYFIKIIIEDKEEFWINFPIKFLEFKNN